MKRGELWIVIPKWRKFQHYNDRNPPWIKVYTDLLDNPNYRQLGSFHRALLHDIWLMYAASQCELPASPAYLSQRLGLPTEAEMRNRRKAGDSMATQWRLDGDSMATPESEGGDRPVRLRDLKRLEQAGWIKLSTEPLLADKPKGASSRVLARGTKAKELKDDDVEPLTTSREAVENIDDGESFDFDKINYSPREMP